MTNVERIERAIAEKACNSLLCKVNQIGTLHESIAAIEMSPAPAVGCGEPARARPRMPPSPTWSWRSPGRSRQAAARSDRVAKYNQLLRIEEQLGDTAIYAGLKAFLHMHRGGRYCRLHKAA